MARTARLRAMVLAGVTGLAFVACGDSASSQSECAPACDGRQCGDDGCGGSCGSCADSAVCSEAGQCVAAECQSTCEELGLACGDHCGTSCGTCGEGTVCDAEPAGAGHCVCEPTCIGKACGDDDGCGGVCGPCAADENCTDCVLHALVVDKDLSSDGVGYVTIAVDFHPPADATLPGIADLRLEVQGPATLERIGTGEAVEAAGKALHLDPLTGKAYRARKDGSLQALLLSPKSKETLGEGRWLLYRFRVGEEGRPAKVPVAFSLVEREKILAPADADQMLWSGGFGEPISVWPEVSGD